MVSLPTQARSNLTRSEMRAPLQESRDLAAELQRTIEGEVHFDGYTRMLYSTDASLYQIQPVGVVIPAECGRCTGSGGDCGTPPGTSASTRRRQLSIRTGSRRSRRARLQQIHEQDSGH